MPNPKHSKLTTRAARDFKSTSFPKPNGLRRQISRKSGEGKSLRIAPTHSPFRVGYQRLSRLFRRLAFPNGLYVSVKPLLRIFQKEFIIDGDRLGAFGKRMLDRSLRFEIPARGFSAHGVDHLLTFD